MQFKNILRVKQGGMIKMQMLKYVLLIAILVLSIYIGDLMSKKYINRVKELIQIKLSLNILKSKIKFTQIPLKDIFEQILKSTEEINIKEFWKNVIKELNNNLEIEVAWKNTIKKTEMNLNNEDLNILFNMGKMLGKTDVDGQISNLEVASTFIDTQIKKAEIEKQKNSKLYKTLGVVSGLAILIILI